ncbi:sporulation initiation factor Spo0A C-terminal domain-containing protein [Oscillospiraceae bacterium MB08-C2-2]|nr:sporulation initiation factor Spo0A C-terminal domain-containing protein [Oscillospiraceae bacterium MB08-C2-2]
MSMRSIYRKIARKHGVTAADVKRDMQAALDYAYQSPNKTQSEKAMQARLSMDSAAPTPEEFIRRAAGQIKKQ